MAEYKRKKIKKSFFHKKKSSVVETNIPMTDKKSKATGIIHEKKIKVVRGNKQQRLQFAKVLIIAIAIVSLSLVILSVSLPVGLYENLVNLSASIGPGSFPLSISGSDIINTHTNGSYYYVLSDSNITAYSNSGKIIIDEFHGFANPIMSVSDTRVLVYDQGGKQAYVYNLGGKIHTLETKKEIITASISKDGFIAVSTQSGQSATVTVYNKNLKQIFSWYSADSIINNALVNNSGKKLAVTTLGVKSGQYESKLLIFNIKTESADPVHTENFGSSIVLSIENTGSGVSAICNDKYKFIHWKKFTGNEVTATGEINLYRNTKNGILLVFNRANNRTDNTIILISKSGKKTAEFNLQSSITDIQYNKGRVYHLSDTTINIFNKNGEKLRSGNCEYGVQKFSVISAYTIAAISDNQITKTTIDKE